MLRELSETPAIGGISDAFGPAVRARMRAYQSAVEVAGCHSDVNLSIRIHRPVVGNPHMAECATIKGFLGQRSRPGGMAFRVESMSVFGRNHELVMPDGSAATLGPGESSRAGLPEPGSILTEFSTPNLPILTARTPSGLESHIIEPAATRANPGVDILTARLHSGMPSSPSPADPELTHIALISHPTKRLLLDVYLHRDMAAHATAYFGGYVWTPSVERDIQSAWPDRIPATPPLAMLGRGIGNAEFDGWPRHAELTRYAFQRLGWNPDDFVGFRGDVVFPIWAAKYAVVFNFNLHNA